MTPWVVVNETFTLPSAAGSGVDCIRHLGHDDAQEGCVVELVSGNISKLDHPSDEEVVDLLVVRASSSSSSSAKGGGDACDDASNNPLVAALLAPNQNNIAIDRLTKQEDLRDSLNCWISTPITRTATTTRDEEETTIMTRPPFRQVLVWEPPGFDDGENKDNTPNNDSISAMIVAETIFAAIIAMAKDNCRTVVLSIFDDAQDQEKELYSSVCQRRSELLKAIVNSTRKWVRRGLPIERLSIVAGFEPAVADPKLVEVFQTLSVGITNNVRNKRYSGNENSMPPLPNLGGAEQLSETPHSEAERIPTTAGGEATATDSLIRIQCLFRQVLAVQTLTLIKKDRKRTKRKGKKSKKAAIRIQAIVRGFLQFRRYKAARRKNAEEDIANLKGKPTFLSSEDEAKAASYLKMLECGLPRGDVANKMALDEASRQIVEFVLGNDSSIANGKIPSKQDGGQQDGLLTSKEEHDNNSDAASALLSSMSATMGHLDAEQMTGLVKKLEEAEKRQTKLDKRQSTAGVEITEDLDYNACIQKVGQIQKRMHEIGGADVTHPDHNAQTRLREEYFRLELAMEKYSSALQLSEDYPVEQDKAEQEWEVGNMEANGEALRRVRRHMPVNIRSMSEAQLMNEPSPNGKYLPKQFAQKFKRSNILQIIRRSPDDIEQMNPSSLENMRTAKLTMTEYRAVYEHLRGVGHLWEKKKNEKTIKQKWEWFVRIRDDFKKALASWESHVAQYGPPDSHPYATRGNSNSGCPLPGSQCPCRAEKLLDYNRDDYGWPDGSEYEVSKVRKADDEGSGAKASLEAQESSTEKTTNKNQESCVGGLPGGGLMAAIASGREGGSNSGRGGLLSTVQGSSTGRGIVGGGRGSLLDVIRGGRGSHRGGGRSGLLDNMRGRSGARGRGGNGRDARTHSVGRGRGRRGGLLDATYGRNGGRGRGSGSGRALVQGPIDTHGGDSVPFHKPSSRARIVLSFAETDQPMAQLVLKALSLFEGDFSVTAEAAKLQTDGIGYNLQVNPLDDAARVIALITPNYVRNLACLDQFNDCLLSGKKSLQPVLVKDTELPKYLQVVQFHDARSGRIDKLVQALSTIMYSLKDETIQGNPEPLTRRSLETRVIDDSVLVGPSFDIFVSYASKMRAQANAVVEILKHLSPDVKYFVDVNELHAGARWQQTLYNALDNSRLVLIIITPAFLKSTFCREEAAISALRTMEGKGKIIAVEAIPVDHSALGTLPIEVANSMMPDESLFKACSRALSLLGTPQQAGSTWDTRALLHTAKINSLEEVNNEWKRGRQQRCANLSICIVGHQDSSQTLFRMQRKIASSLDSQSCVKVLTPQDHELDSMDVATILICVLSAAFLGSGFCLNALNIGILRNRTDGGYLIPIAIEVLNPHSTPSFVRLLPTLDATGWDEQEENNVLQELLVAAANMSTTKKWEDHTTLIAPRGS